MLRIKTVGVFSNARKDKYWIEKVLLLLILLSCFVIYLQSKYMETYHQNMEMPALDLHNSSHQYTSSVHMQWQSVKTTSYKLYVYSAFYDNRRTGTIRIIGLAEPHFKDDIQCQLFYHNSDSEYLFIPAIVEPISKENTTELVPVFMTCILPVPGNSEVPRAVSVVTSSHPMISNILLIQRSGLENRYSQTIVACVQPLGNHFSQILRLIEFIELNTLLGVSHFLFYNQSVSHQLSCVLSDYANQGRLTVLQWSFPKSETNSGGKVQSGSSLTAFNDCLYRTMPKFEYVMFINIDEFIIPRNNKSLLDFIRSKKIHINHGSTGAYIFKTANFYREWPDEDWKGRNIFGAYVMSIYKTYRSTNNKFNTTLSKPSALLKVDLFHDLQLISGYQSMIVDESEVLCHRYCPVLGAYGPPDLVTQAVQDRTAHKYAHKLMRAMGAQWLRALPHCTLSGEADVRILNNNNVPILL